MKFRFIISYKEYIERSSFLEQCGQAGRVSQISLLLDQYERQLLKRENVRGNNLTISKSTIKLLYASLSMLKYF